MKKITQKVLKEEITKKEINLVKNFIQTFFNNVLFIEETVTFFGTPKLIVHFESSSKAINIESWFWISFLGIISTGLGTYLLFEGIKHIEVSKGMSLAFCKPIFATFLAFFILKELPTITLLISISLVITSIMLINRTPSFEKKSKVP